MAYENSCFDLVCDKKVEAVYVELKDLNSRAGHKKVLKGRLSAKEGQREALLKQLRPGRLTFILYFWHN